MYGPRHKTYSESHNLPDDDFRLSEPKLRLSLQRMYEKGRASVKIRPFSLSDILAGSCVAELITSIFHAASGSFQFSESSSNDRHAAFVHVVICVILGILSSVAYYGKSVRIQQQCGNNHDRDRSVSKELSSLVYGDAEYDDYAGM